MVYFEVPGMPQGKARARTFYNPKLGRSQSITPEKTVLYENLIKQCFASKNAKGWFEKEPLEMEITARFPVLKSMSKKDKKAAENYEIFPTKRPDADNIAKVICDALNGVAYHDDTQIIRLDIIKVYTSGQPYVGVKITEFTAGR